MTERLDNGDAGRDTAARDATPPIYIDAKHGLSYWSPAAPRSCGRPGSFPVLGSSRLSWRGSSPTQKLVEHLRAELNLISNINPQKARPSPLFHYQTSTLLERFRIAQGKQLKSIFRFWRNTGFYRFILFILVGSFTRQEGFTVWADLRWDMLKLVPTRIMMVMMVANTDYRSRSYASVPGNWGIYSNLEKKFKCKYKTHKTSTFVSSQRIIEWRKRGWRMNVDCLFPN